MRDDPRVAAGERWLEKDYLTPLFRSVDRTRLSEPAEIDGAGLDRAARDSAGAFEQRHRHAAEHLRGRGKGLDPALFEKLGSRTRAQLVRIALEQYETSFETLLSIRQLQSKDSADGSAT